MSRMYRQDIRITATVYVRANSAKAAAGKIAEQFGEGSGGELPIGSTGEVVVSARTFDDPRLEDVTISPAVSFHGAAPGSRAEKVE